MSDTLQRRSANAERARALLAGIKVVDSDTHLTEPHDLWTSRAPAKWKDKVPQVRDVDGKPRWIVNGDKVMGVATGACVVRNDGSKIHGWGFMNCTMDDIHPASFNVKERVKFMDQAGIWAQILYPNFLGFGGQTAKRLDDDIKLVTFQIYNDAMAEFQQESGNRIFPMAMLPWWNIADAAAEARRCHQMGLRGVNTNSSCHKHGLPDLGQREWDPLWETCCDLNLPVNFHIGSGEDDFLSKTPWPSQTADQKLALGSTMAFVGNANVISNLLYSGVLERFPRLKLSSVESGAGWIPFVLEALDYELEEATGDAAGLLSMKPSEYFRRQIYACFWFEQKGLAAALDAIGPDNLMFETDFPHPTCLYPEPLGQAAEVLDRLTPEVRRKIMSENAARLYSLPI
ncbi:MAG TPA: amidohydrolase family protein [Candidatus Binataceae bacterium]|nr:amidohydrolase family protein [Candidatus Binataceae bacterium]